jgi:hypothetical protein
VCDAPHAASTLRWLLAKLYTNLARIADGHPINRIAELMS